MISSTPPAIPASTSRSEPRNDRVLDDHPRQRVGQDSLEAIPDLDSHFALVRSDDEQRTVVLALLADAPRPTKLIAEILDRRALQ